VFNYTSSKSRATYMLNTNLLSQEDAQTFCNDQGGHLAGYDSLAEQIEVEQRFIKDVGGSA
jgi:nitrous oxide reductase accessory protein NosL